MKSTRNDSDVIEHLAALKRALEDLSGEFNPIECIVLHPRADHALKQCRAFHEIARYSADEDEGFSILGVEIISGNGNRAGNTIRLMRAPFSTGNQLERMFHNATRDVIRSLEGAVLAWSTQANMTPEEWLQHWDVTYEWQPMEDGKLNWSITAKERPAK